MTTPDPIIAQLAQDARAKEARMLPGSGDLSPQHLDHVRKRLASFINDSGKKLPAVAKLMGRSPGSLLKFTTAEYDETLDDYIRFVDTWLNTHAINGGIGMPAEMVKTTVTENMLGVIGQAVQLGSMVAIVGPSGVGKSLVFRTMTHKMPGTIHIELSAVDASKSALVQRIASEVAGTARHRMQESFNALVKTLAGSRRLIILDEAHYLTEQAFNIVRDLHKRTGCPVVFGGTMDILGTIDDFDAFHGQFKRLVSAVYNITEDIINAGGTPLYTVDEVLAFSKAMGIRLTLDGADEALGYANTLGWGGFGALGFLLINAQSYARHKTGNPRASVTADIISKSLRLMEGHSGLERTKSRGQEQLRRVKTA